jgi:Bifunctional DNA primase/polymerase, N-terminal/Primase C terminal 1 (PriCT-1)
MNLNPAKSASKLDAAIKYRQRGFSVIPIEPRGKKPLLNWVSYQTERAEPSEVKKWFADSAAANIAIVTGAISDLVVIDIDSESAKNELKRIVGDYELDRVPRAKTGKGWQLFFEHPGVNISNRAGVIPGLDVRGDGGYVVVPPSIHPNGKTYQWEVALNGELPKLPVELFKLISSPPNGGNGYREKFNTAQALRGVPEGQRDETLFKLSCKLRSADVPQDMAEILILECAKIASRHFQNKRL